MASLLIEQTEDEYVSHNTSPNVEAQGHPPTISEPSRHLGHLFGNGDLGPTHAAALQSEWVTGTHLETSQDSPALPLSIPPTYTNLSPSATTNRRSASPLVDTKNW